MKITTFQNLHSQQGSEDVMEWGGFCRLIRDVPAYSTKQEQPLIKLGEFTNVSRASGNHLHTVHGLELDYDDGELTAQQAQAKLAAAGCQAIVCSTYTSTPDNPKWRAFLPLSKSYDARHRAALVGACDAVLGHVIAPESYTEKQIFFIGRNPETEYQVMEVEGQPVDTLPDMQQLARAYVQERNKEAKAQANIQTEALKRASVERLTDGQVSVIDAFNEAYDVGAILTSHGYIRRGKRYQSPTSTSRMAGINVLKCRDGKDRIYSHHNSDLLNTGRAHDAFDVYAILEHGGDHWRAVQAAALMLYTSEGSTLHHYNREVWRKQRALKRTQAIMEAQS